MLDWARDAILGGKVTDAVVGLIDELSRLRLLIDRASWWVFCDSVCAAHPIRGLIHESPFARRAFEKPRGYAGDAETLDLAYGITRPPRGTSELGARVFGAELQFEAMKGIRERRDMLAAMVDAAAQYRSSPRVLSLACGHLREAQLCGAAQQGKLGAYYAVDQDAASLSRIEHEQPNACITTRAGTVKDLLAGRIDLTGLDLAYTAGLYDYLPTRLARSVTAALFSMVSAGGRVVVANCAPNWDAMPYMEAFMDWRLIYRAESEMTELAASIAEREIDDMRLFRNPSGNVVFLEIVKRTN